MADALGRDTSEIVRLTGSLPDGEETNPIGSTTDGEVWIRDTHDNGGIDGILALTTTPSEGIVGGSRKVNRKYVIIEALDTNVVWGFSSSTQSFDLFKSQLIMVPIGENTEIWFKMKVGTGDVAFAELS